MTTSIDWEALRAPFAHHEIEWRIQEAGKRDGTIWARVIPYVSNRPIMNRLDQVCGPGGWRNEFTVGPGGGVICTIYIKVDGEWIGKSDGAENTNIEAVKGGLSDSMKRAAVQWSLGRYLYLLDAGWAHVEPKSSFEGSYYARLPKEKGGDVFYWAPPQLPLWAQPGGSGRPDIITGKQLDEITKTPVGNDPPKPKNGATPKQPTKAEKPGDGSSRYANTKVVIQKCFTLAELDKCEELFQKYVDQGEQYTADEVKTLEALIIMQRGKLESRTPART